MFKKLKVTNSKISFFDNSYLKFLVKNYYYNFIVPRGTYLQITYKKLLLLYSLSIIVNLLYYIQFKLNYNIIQ